MKPRWGPPRLEEFEPRLVLDAFKWNYTMGGMGDWGDVNNWVQNGLPASRLPDRTDDVTFDGAYADGSCALNGERTVGTLKLINKPGPISLNSGSLIVWGGAIDSVMTSGTIDISTGNEFAIQGGFDWYGGRLNGPGTVAVVGTNARMTITGPTEFLDSQSLDANLIIGVGAIPVPGAVVIQNLNQDVSVGNSYGIQVGSLASLTFGQGSGNLTCNTGSTSPTSVISNAGTVSVNTTGTYGCDLPLFNTASTATLDVQQGTLEFTKGAAQGGFSVSQSAGNINLHGGATLKADANTNINGGVLDIIPGSGGTTASLGGNLTVQAGTVEFNYDYGNSQYAVLQVGGQLSLIGTSTLLVHVDGQGTNCDEIDATGTITLGGSAALSVTTDGGPATASYNVLWSVTGYSGDFASWSYSGGNYTPGWINDPLVGFDYQLTPAA